MLLCTSLGEAVPPDLRGLVTSHQNGFMRVGRVQRARAHAVSRSIEVHAGVSVWVLLFSHVMLRPALLASSAAVLMYAPPH